MFRIEQINNLFDCSLCNNLLVDPIALACGNTICKSHIDAGEHDEFKCDLCHENHCAPKNGFVINKHIQKTLDIKLNTLELSPVFNECKKTLEKATEKCTYFEAITKNPESLIYEYFDGFKRMVDLRKKDLKLKIDQYSEELTKSIEATCLKCVKVSNQASLITIEFDKSKNELEELVGRFDTFEINEKKFENIKNSTEILDDRFNKMLKEYKRSVLNYQKYSFDFQERSISDVFGKFFRIYSKVKAS